MTKPTDKVSGPLPTKRAVNSAVGKASLPTFPWRVEVLGNTRRIVDAEGNDLARLGDAHNVGDREVAEFIVRVANAASEQQQ